MATHFQLLSQPSEFLLLLSLFFFFLSSFLLSSSISKEEEEDGGGGAGVPSAAAAQSCGGGALIWLHRVSARSTNTNYVKYYVCSLETRCTKSEIKKQ